MLMCETDVVGYLAKIEWSAPSRLRTVYNCQQQTGFTYICSSKLFFIPSPLDNQRLVSCYLYEETGREYLAVQRGRLKVEGKLWNTQHAQLVPLQPKHYRS